MAILTAEQVNDYARGAGFGTGLTGMAAAREVMIAVEIARLESGFNTNAHNPIGRDDSYGLWQINMKDELGPARRQQFGLQRNEDLYDPATNARVARSIYVAEGWEPWSTADIAIATVDRALDRIKDELGDDIWPDVPIISDIASWAQGLTRLLANLLSPTWWKRVGLAVLGVALVVIAFFLYGQETQPIGQG